MCLVTTNPSTNARVVLALVDVDLKSCGVMEDYQGLGHACRVIHWCVVIWRLTDRIERTKCWWQWIAGRFTTLPPKHIKKQP